MKTFSQNNTFNLHFTYPKMHTHSPIPRMERFQEKQQTAMQHSLSGYTPPLNNEQCRMNERGWKRDEIDRGGSEDSLFRSSNQPLLHQLSTRNRNAINTLMADLTEYKWIVIFATIVCFISAFGMGSCCFRLIMVRCERCG